MVFRCYLFKSMPTAMITHDPAGHRFTLEQDGHLACVEYRLADQQMIITHTLVPEAVAGQGIAARLNEQALEHARQSGLTVVPVCSYTQSYIRRHPQYQDLVVR